jgi:predicted ATPase/class 3 adenylate cyclase/Flp pilus assembly protein TadD
MEPVNYPLGTVTFLFTDIEGYSTSETKIGALFQPVLDAHYRILREVAETYDGLEIRTIGDSLFLAFDRPTNAVRFAVDAQHALRNFSWQTLLPPDGDALQEIRVRMGMHTGEARTIHHPGGQIDYFGTTVNCAARVSSAAHGGQVLVSEATRLLAQGSLPPDIRFQDLGVYRLKGFGEEHLWQLLNPGLPDHFPPVSAMQEKNHNLPLPLTPFLGREKQLQEWTAKLLESGTRLMTIAGFGGMGKTRLAQQIAEECTDVFKDGVWWVPLENATNGDEMLQRIAEQLMKNLKPPPSVRDQLWNFHRDKELLLVLDNLEQIPLHEVAQIIVGLLNAGPRVKILATSRRSLQISAERLVELEPFVIGEAEALFIERAQARKASFSIDRSNEEDVKKLCRKLEGVPLAIEIAASRVVLMSPRQILQRLDDQLKLLVTRDPSLPPRHAALRGAIEWSHQLLSDDAKSLFAQLSVFAGGFALEAAEAIAQRNDGIPFDVLDSLMELRNQSLLRNIAVSEMQEERLTMLESVREYASEQLTDEGAYRRHAEYYCEWAQQHNELLRTSDEAAAVAAVELEFDNLRASLNWAEKNDALLCAHLALAFNAPLHLRGHWEETDINLRKGWEALVLIEGNGELLRLRADLRHQQAGLLQDIGDLEKATALAQESLEAYRKADDKLGVANTLNLLGTLATDEGQFDEARQLCREALELWPSSHLVGRGKTLHNLARAEQESGNPEEARRIYEEALPMRRQSGDNRGLAKTLSNLGTIANMDGDYTEARRLYSESLSLLRYLDQPLNIAIMLNNIGDIEMHEKQFENALIFFIHAERIFTKLKSPYAKEASGSLTALETELGKEEYDRLHNEAMQKAWEDLCKPDY